MFWPGSGWSGIGAAAAVWMRERLRGGSGSDSLPAGLCLLAGRSRPRSADIFVLIVLRVSFLLLLSGPLTQKVLMQEQVLGQNLLMES